MGGGVTWMKFPNLHRKACFSKPTSFVVGGDKFNKECFTRNWMKFQTSTDTMVANPPPLWGWKVGKDDFSHGVEGWQIWHLCRSWNFNQFLAKKATFSCILTSAPTHTMAGSGKYDFPVQMLTQVCTFWSFSLQIWGVHVAFRGMRDFV